MSSYHPAATARLDGVFPLLGGARSRAASARAERFATFDRRLAAAAAAAGAHPPPELL
jgi:hypothetical protein